MKYININKYIPVKPITKKIIIRATIIIIIIIIIIMMKINK